MVSVVVVVEVWRFYDTYIRPNVQKAIIHSKKLANIRRSLPHEITRYINTKNSIIKKTCVHSSKNVSRQVSYIV